MATGSAVVSDVAAVDEVVAYLSARWRRVFRLMTIDQALAGLGITPSWALRRAVVERLRAEPGLSPVLRRWGVATLALSNDERLLGRALAAVGQPLGVGELAARLTLVPSVVRERLQMLVYLGIATLDAERVALATDHEAKLGPLGWHFQAMQLDDEPPFNIPCPVDFLLLAHGTYRERRLTLRGTCARSAAPIRVVASDGAITAVEPATTLVFRGGG